MCLIVQAGDSSVIPEDLVKSAKTKNPHGWGIIFHDEGKVHMRKGIKMDDVDKYLKKVRQGSKVFVHFRLATHGTVSIENAHPFKLTDEVYFMHNGVMHKFDDPKKIESDSKIFADTILKPLVIRCGPRVILEPFFQQIVKEFGGGGNRFAFMNSVGDVLRIGSWEEDETNKLFLSNSYAYDTKTVDIKRFTYTPVNEHNWRGNNWSKDYGNKVTSPAAEIIRRADFYDKDDYDDDNWYRNGKTVQDYIDKKQERIYEPEKKSTLLIKTVKEDSPATTTTSPTTETVVDKEEHPPTQQSTSTAQKEGQEVEIMDIISKNTSLVEANPLFVEEKESMSEPEYSEEEYLDETEMVAERVFSKLADTDIETITDLRYLSQEDIEALCECEPEFMAEIIVNSIGVTINSHYRYKEMSMDT